MLRNVFLKTLRDQRRSLLWWGLSLVALAIITILFYPAVRDAPEINELVDQMPEALLKAFSGEFSDFTSPEGFLNSQLFFLFAPLLFIIFAVAFGSGTIAGEETRGTLGLLLSNPVARWQVVAQKFGAMAIATLLLAFTFWVGLVVGSVAVGMEISLGRLAEATLSAALLGLAFGTLALALGCAKGSRGMSVGIASALGVASYLLNALAPLADAIEPFQKLSPFYYFIGADPLANGLDPAHAAVLIGLAVVALATALVTFERRDLAV